MGRAPYQIAREAAENAQHVPVTITVPYELRHELADWIIAEVQKLEAGAAMNRGAPRVRGKPGIAAPRKTRADRMQGRADLWRRIYDQVVP